MNKGFTEPQGMTQPIIGDGNLNEGQTTYLGGDSMNIVPPPASYYPPAQSGPPAPQTYWNNQGQMVDAHTGQVLQNQPAQYQPPQYQAPQAPGQGSNNGPRTHLVELQDRFVILVDVPGISIDGILIEFDDPNITISGKRVNPIDDISAKCDGEFKEQTNIIYDDFVLKYKMSKNIESTSASIKDGVLCLEAFFKAKSGPVAIKIG